MDESVNWVDFVTGAITGISATVAAQQPNPVYFTALGATILLGAGFVVIIKVVCNGC